MIFVREILYQSVLIAWQFGKCGFRIGNSFNLASGTWQGDIRLQTFSYYVSYALIILYHREIVPRDLSRIVQCPPPYFFCLIKMWECMTVNSCSFMTSTNSLLPVSNRHHITAFGGRYLLISNTAMRYVPLNVFIGISYLCYRRTVIS